LVVEINDELDRHGEVVSFHDVVDRTLNLGQDDLTKGKERFIRLRRFFKTADIRTDFLQAHKLVR
jgi:hypothetical protein